MQGAKLGTVAHLIALRRTAIGDVSVEDAWHLDELADTVKSRRWAHITGAAERLAEGSSHGHASRSSPQLGPDHPAGILKLSNVDGVDLMDDMPPRKTEDHVQALNCSTNSTQTS